MALHQTYGNCIQASPEIDLKSQDLGRNQIHYLHKSSVTDLPVELSYKSAREKLRKGDAFCSTENHCKKGGWCNEIQRSDLTQGHLQGLMMVNRKKC